MSIVDLTVELEKYKLVTGIQNGSTPQIVNCPDTGTSTGRSWKRKRRLGQGSFSEVWQEVWEDKYGDSHYRAVKSYSESETRAKDFGYKKELSALVAFSRPDYASWFVNLHGWWMQSGNIYVAIDYLSFGDLSQYIPEGIPEIETKEIAEGVLQGLRIMHGNRFIHCDIKPQNILVFRKPPEFHRWWVKIANFEISKQIATDSEATLHTIVGTPRYCAPEVLGYLDSHNETSIYSSKVDMWSMGCVLFSLGSLGQLPFSQVDLARYCAGVVDFNPENFPLNLSHTGESFVRALLLVEPNQRPTAAEALQHPWLGTTMVTESEWSSGSLSRSTSDYQQNFNPLPDSTLSSDPNVYPTARDPAMRPARTTSSANTNFVDLIMPIHTYDHPDEHQNGSCTLQPFQEPLSKENGPETPTAQGMTDRSTTSKHSPVEAVPDLLKSATDTDGQATTSTRSDVPKESQGDASSDLSRWLTDNKGEIRHRKLQNDTPLHLAAERGNLQIVKQLIQTDVEIVAKNKSRWTPLNLAAKNGHLQVVQCLVEQAKADIHAINNVGLTTLHIAAIHGRLEVVQWLVDEGTADVHTKSQDGSNPLHDAALNNQPAVVRWLVEQGGADIHAKNNIGSTPLHNAAGHGHLEVVRWLVEQGRADVHAKSHQRSNINPLHYAARNGHLEVVRYLVEQGRANVHAQYDFGFTPLHDAVRNGHLEVVRWLVEKGGADVHAKNKFGWTPLHNAAGHGHLEVVRWLVEQGGADVHAKTNLGRTPRIYAKDEGKSEIVAWLKTAEGKRHSTISKMRGLFP